MDEKYIGAVYSMLAEKGKVLPKFPIEYVRQGLPAKSLKVFDINRATSDLSAPYCDQFGPTKGNY